MAESTPPNSQHVEYKQKYPETAKTITEAKNAVDPNGDNVIKKNELVKLAKDALGDNKDIICEYPRISTAVLETAADKLNELKPDDVSKTIKSLIKLDAESDKAILGLSDADYKELNDSQIKIFARSTTPVGRLTGEGIKITQNPDDIDGLLKTNNIDKLTVKTDDIEGAVHEFCAAPKTPPVEKSQQNTKGGFSPA